jgi:DNA-binding CsgD family transcriptional regulator
LDFRRLETAKNALANVAFAPDQWENTLREVAAACGTGRAQLVAFGGPNFIPFNRTNDIDPAFINEFPQIDGGSPEVNWRVACAGAPFQLARETDYAEARKRIRRGVYDDFVSHFDLPYGCQCVLTQKPGLMIGMAVLRQRADSWSTPEDCEAFLALAPHVLQAVRTQLAIGEEAAHLLSNSLDAMQAAAMVLDGFGHIRSVTPAADLMLRKGDILRAFGERLSAARIASDILLQKAIADILSERAGSARLVLLGEDVTEVACHLVAYPQREHEFGFAPRVLVLLKQPEHLGASHAEDLVRMFGLTASEAHVAIAAANGQSREQIAMTRKKSSGTVNAQFKSIFRKMDVSREAELVSFINRILR